MDDDCSQSSVEGCKEQLEAYLLENSVNGPEGVVLHRYLKAVVIDALKHTKDKKELSKTVVGTFSRLLCLGKDPETELPNLQKSLGVGGPCGKILQYGEPTFSCLECALDRTCVMCMDCYNASPHAKEKHNLLVNTSQGCGMCDCGDVEAWKYVSKLSNQLFEDFKIPEIPVSEQV